MLVVKKFGGTSVGNKERIMNVAKRCIEDYKKGNDVVVVLSAMGKMKGKRDQSKSIQKRNGYVINNRRTDFCIFNGNGNGFPWSSSCILKCVSGSNAYNICIQ